MSLEAQHAYLFIHSLNALRHTSTCTDTCFVKACLPDLYQNLCNLKGEGRLKKKKKKTLQGSRFLVNYFRIK